VPNADSTSVLGARDDATQLEEGILQARVDVGVIYHTGGGHEIGRYMPGGWIY
jgi:hypothetical protein